jgi:hypothetical protein
MVTMEPTLSVREGLVRMRDEQLRKLAGMATDKREAERLLQQVHLLEKAIEQSDPEVGGHKYARFKSAILAILAYLDEVGSPVPREQLIAALLDGGWRKGDDKAETNLKQSIASFSTGLGRKTGQIKEVKGLIGRGEWDEALFKKTS